MSPSNSPLHVASSSHPVAAEAVAELVVQLLDSIGFAPPPAVLHLAICGTHALHAEAIVSAAGELIRPRILTAELHEAVSELSASRTREGILRALAIAPGAAAVGTDPAAPSAPGAEHTEASAACLDPERPSVRFSGATGTDDGDPISMHWNADRVLCWTADVGVRHVPALEIRLDPTRLAWLCGPRVDQLPLVGSTEWSAPLWTAWRGDRISTLDDRPASDLVTERLDSLLRQLAAERREESAGGSFDELEGANFEAAEFEGAEFEDPADLGVWVVWPERDMPAPLDRLTTLARVDSVHHISGSVRLRPIPAIDRTEPVRLLAVNYPPSYSMSRAGGPAFVVRTLDTDPMGLDDAASMPWPVADLFVSTDDQIPVPLAGAMWCLAPRTQFENHFDD